MSQRITHWTFTRTHQGAELPARQITVPHDWSIEDVPFTSSPFSAVADSGAAGGWAAGGQGVYSTTLKLDVSRRHRITFQGVFGESQIFVDGEKAAEHFYGYTPFSLVIPAGKESAEVVVKVENVGEVGRWYTGSGIYRPVELEALGEIAILRDGLVGRPSLSDGRWMVEARAETEAECSVEFVLRDPQGRTLSRATAQSSPELLARHVFEIESPQLWNPWDSPLAAEGDQPLYRLEARVAGDETEPSSVFLGLREISVSPTDGMKVNGERCLLKGGCIHHDNGILGACAFDSAENRKIALLKKAGFNAIRTAHNPPSPALLDACDREGILVIDEVHDEWELPKRKDSYHRHFPEHALKDAQAMVRRDRSRPSVWCWSIGNEILDSFERPDICLKLRQAVFDCDSTRPITAGLCRPWWPAPDWVDWASSSEPGCRHLDIVGMNYMWQEVRPDHERHSDRLMMQTETYALAAWESWKSVEECPWNLGDFVWTAQDYIGESGIGQAFAHPQEPVKGDFPSHLAVCGDLDLIGDRRPQSFYRESLWRKGALAAAVRVPERVARPTLAEHWHPNWGWRQVESHWTWPGFEGETLALEVMTSCQRAAVKLNRRALFEKQVQSENLVIFEVPYEPGVLEVTGWDENGREQTIELRTCRGASLIRLEPGCVRASLEKGDLLWLGVTLTDSEGVRSHHDDASITLEIDGPADLLGFGSASPVDVDSLQDAVHTTFQGRALAVLRPKGKGVVTVRAWADELQESSASFEVT